MPINILCIYRSPTTDTNTFIKTLSKVIKENKKITIQFLHVI